MGEQVGATLLKKICGGVAQLGEHLPCKQGVKSSNLSISMAGELSKVKPQAKVRLGSRRIN